jgi:hypothetical protein
MAPAFLLATNNILYQLFHLVRLLSEIIFFAKFLNFFVRLAELRIYTTIL